MKTLNTYLFIIFIFLFSFKGFSQIGEDKIGAWYMYFWNTEFKESQWGLQGDVQYRNWNLIGDLEQLLLRGGLTYTPKTAKIKLTLGYANITTGAFGSDADGTTSESRIYQEALFPSKVGNRLYFNHRIRYEQRWVENQDFRTRYRYNLFLNVPLNQSEISEGAIYLALYNELFLNGERNIGDNRRVEIFDRNRTYFGLGYSLSPKVNIQLGYMRQVTDNWGKNQLQFSIHHKI